MSKQKLDYPVILSNGIFDVENHELVNLLRDITGDSSPKVMLVADGNVVQYTKDLGSRIGRYFSEHKIQMGGASVVLQGGEKIKSDNHASVFKVAHAALDAKIGANDVILALGGGALLDVAGFAAAQVRGGVKIVRIPTSVSAMVDAAFATTAAVNTPRIKDAFKVASMPSAVVIDIDFTKTLLDGVWRGGCAQALRCAITRDGALVRKIVKSTDKLKARDMKALRVLVSDSIKLHREKDETSFALWSAARMETLSNYKLPHGYSVPISICLDLAYAVTKNLIKREDQELVCECLYKLGALDNLFNSRYLLREVDRILVGLDAWKLSHVDGAIELPTGIGKGCMVSDIDRDAYKMVFANFVETMEELNKHNSVSQS
jgi:3-dehydroquinate synthase